jgi:diadenosine tetraphosphate (Ap4A) HIT family hydrolase
MSRAAAPLPDCPLCTGAGGVPVWHDAAWRVVRVEDADFPAYYRVVAREHVREFSDLDTAARSRCMALVATVERVLIDRLAPTKINLAAFGNVVPHLHWHVTARFDWDSHFPQPLWGARQREVDPPAAARLVVPLAELDMAVAGALAAGYTGP